MQGVRRVSYFLSGPLAGKHHFEVRIEQGFNAKKVQNLFLLQLFSFITL